MQRLATSKANPSNSKHKDEIEVLSFSWGVTMPPPVGTGGGSGAGKAVFQNLSLVHAIDSASPKLLEACATGMHIKDATVTHRKAGKGQQEYLILKMTDVTVTGVVHGGASGEVASETITLAFSKVDLEYKPINATGAPGAGIHFKFDIKGNKVG